MKAAEVRSHSEHELCPQPPPGRVWKVSFTGSLALWSWSPAGLSGRCGLHGPSLDLWKWQGCTQAHQAGPGHPSLFCQLWGSREGLQERNHGPASARGSHSSSISHPLLEEREGGKEGEGSSEREKGGQGREGRDGGEGETEGEGEGGGGEGERARQGDRLSKDQMLAKVLIRKENF